MKRLYELVRFNTDLDCWYVASQCVDDIDDAIEIARTEFGENDRLGISVIDDYGESRGIDAIERVCCRYCLSYDYLTKYSRCINCSQYN